MQIGSRKGHPETGSCPYHIVDLTTGQLVERSRRGVGKWPFLGKERPSQFGIVNFVQNPGKAGDQLTGAKDLRHRDPIAPLGRLPGQKLPALDPVVHRGA